MAKKIFFIALVCVVIALPPVWEGIKNMTLLLRSLDVNQVIVFIRSFGAWAPVISFFLMTFCIIAPFPSFLITFANSAVFGWVYGAVLSWSGAMVGALICFAAARFFGRDVIEKFTTKAALQRVDVFFDQHGKYAVLIARLLPFLSFSLISYGAGLTSLRLIPYLLATGIGQLPATLIYSYVGGMLTGGIRYVVLGLFCLLAFSAILFTAKKYFTAKKIVTKST